MIARRNDIGVAGEAKRRLGSAVVGPHVGDVAEWKPLDLESRRRQALGEEGLAAGIRGRHGMEPDKFLREIEGRIHFLPE
jgi:hypothetical protein